MVGDVWPRPPVYAICDDAAPPDTIGACKTLRVASRGWGATRGAFLALVVLLASVACSDSDEAAAPTDLDRVRAAIDATAELRQYRLRYDQVYAGASQESTCGIELGDFAAAIDVDLDSDAVRTTSRDGIEVTYQGANAIVARQWLPHEWPVETDWVVMDRNADAEIFDPWQRSKRVVLPSTDVPGEGESVLVARPSVSIIDLLRDPLSARRVDGPTGDDGATRYEVELDRERFLDLVLEAVELPPGETVSEAELDAIGPPVVHVTITDGLVTVIETTTEIADYDEFELVGEEPEEDIELADSVTAIIQISALDGVVLPDIEAVTRFADLGLSYEEARQSLDSAYFPVGGMSDVAGCLGFIAFDPDAKG